MKTLAIETATAASSVALGEDGKLAAMTIQVDRRGHVGFLVPAIDFCLERVGWRADQLDTVVVDVGPGLFTGIRAGLATAQGIAAAVGAQLFPATSLDALAFRAATGRRRIWPLVDVRRGQLATAPYRPVPGGVIRDGAPELVSSDELRGLIEGDSSDVLLVGDTEAVGESLLRGIHRAKVGRPRFPSADVLLAVAARRMEREDFPDELRPVYLREPDVRINWSDFREEAGWPGPASA